jgi:hypothetical protein
VKVCLEYMLESYISLKLWFDFISHTTCINFRAPICRRRSWGPNFWRRYVYTLVTAKYGVPVQLYELDFFNLQARLWHKRANKTCSLAGLATTRNKELAAVLQQVRPGQCTHTITATLISYPKALFRCFKVPKNLLGRIHGVLNIDKNN